MSIDAVRAYLARWNRSDDILEMPDSTATVQLAAQALGTQPERIAKSISLYHGDSALVLVTAGDAKINNGKFKARFGFKPRMLAGADVEPRTGHQIGGVCPFALPEGVEVYLDDSLKRFQTVFPACGSANSAIELTLPQLEEYARAKDWVDVTNLMTSE